MAGHLPLALHNDEETLGSSGTGRGADKPFYVAVGEVEISSGAQPSMKTGCLEKFSND